MSATGQDDTERARLLRVIAFGAITALVLLGLYLAQDLVGLFPWWIKRHPVEWSSVAFVACYSLARALGKYRHREILWIDWLAWTMDRVEAVSGIMLRRWFVVGFAGLSIYWLLTWLPHYLYWPWCRDVDTYALMAQEWDSGVLPFRDIRALGFPGHIYLHWILGKLFGWGHTGIFYAVDAAALLCLGAVVILWSHRRLGLVLPGMVAYFIFLAYYLDINFEMVAERDWHAPLCMMLGLLLLEAWPGRRTRWLSALLAGIAITIRPNIVLFLPALLVAVARGADATRAASATDTLRIITKEAFLAALEWLCAFCVFAMAGFSPLFLSGVMDDFVRSLEAVRRGGSYSDATTARSIAILWEELRQPKIWALLVSLVLISLRSSDRELKLLARTWLLALTGALVYRPIHPVDHAYLKTPLALVDAVAWAIPITWLVRAATAKRLFGSTLLPGVLGILLIVYEGIPWKFPGNCSARVSIDSIRARRSAAGPCCPRGHGSGIVPRAATTTGTITAACCSIFERRRASRRSWPMS